jgi:hypothetical protein
MPRILLLGDFAPVKSLIPARFEIDLKDIDLILRSRHE